MCFPISEVCFNLGSMYLRGEGVPQDEERAMTLYREATALGSEEAELALRKLNGEGSEYPWRGDSKLVERLRTGVKQGDAEAMYDLSELYSRGYAVEPDARKDLELLEQAAALGSSRAQYALGCRYLALRDRKSVV